MAARPAFTVSAPGVDRSYREGGPALSAAITAASKVPTGTNVYVRDPHGNPYGRVERHDHGLLIYRTGAGR